LTSCFSFVPDNSFGDSFEFTKNNVVGTHVLLEAARLHGVYRMIHISTDEVYGEADSNLLEEAVLQPTNPYSASKAAAEMLVNAYSKSFNLPVIITRSNNVYGPYQYPEKVIPKFVSLLKRGKKVCLHGNGSNSRRYIFASDVADAIDTILHKGKVGEIYNIGTDFEITNLDLAKKLIEEFGLTSRQGEFLEYVEDRAFNDRRYAVDSNKLEQLGWKPRVEWEDGLTRTSGLAAV
jgi:dTDP-glucose 4,6-dehydratase